MMSPGDGRPTITDAGYTTVAVGSGHRMECTARCEAGGRREWSYFRPMVAATIGIRCRIRTPITITTTITTMAAAGVATAEGRILRRLRGQHRIR